MAGTSWEEQNQSLGASLSLAGACFPPTALLTLCTDTLAVSPASSAAQSGFLSLVFAPSLVGLVGLSEVLCVCHCGMQQPAHGWVALHHFTFVYFY